MIRKRQPNRKKIQFVKIQEQNNQELFNQFEQHEQPSEKTSQHGPRTRTHQRGSFRIKPNKYNEFEGVINGIQKRGSTFVRLGFTSDQKKRNRKLLGDVFNLRQRDISSTLTIADLWSNKERVNFLKENKIKTSKMKLLERLTILRKKINPSPTASNNGTLHSINLLGSEDEIEIEKSLRTIRNTAQKIPSERDIYKSMLEIRNNLKKLKGDEGDRDLKHKVRKMQEYQDKFEQMQKKYFIKLIQMI